jgi:hypothetical protein
LPETFDSSFAPFAKIFKPLREILKFLYALYIYLKIFA